MYPLLPVCYGCKHIISTKEWQCAAFTRKIPIDIIISKHDHRQPYDGDGGIRFEAIEEDEG